MLSTSRSWIIGGEGVSFPTEIFKSQIVLHFCLLLLIFWRFNYNIASIIIITIIIIFIIIITITTPIILAYISINSKYIVSFSCFMNFCDTTTSSNTKSTTYY